MRLSRPNSDESWREHRKLGDLNNHYPDCPYCETPFFYADGHLDHIFPRSSGGTNKLNNLVLVCKECNQSKRNTRLDLWLYIQGISLEAVYIRLKAQGKGIPADMLDTLGYDD